MDGILEVLPLYALYGFYAAIAVIIGLALLSVWRHISPATPGIPLGYYEIIGRYGSSLMTRIEGTLVDATPIFLSPGNQQRLKKFLSSNIDIMMKKMRNQEEATARNAVRDLQDLKRKLNGLQFDKICRIISTRDRSFRKHILIQYKHVSQPLSEYARYERKGKLTLSAGLISRGVITGTIKTLPEPLYIPGFGKFHVHLFAPDVEAHSANEPPTWLAKIALYMPSVAEVTELIESKDQQIAELTRQLREMGKQVAAAATTRDVMWRIIAGISTEKAPLEMEQAQPERIPIKDLILIGGPTVFGAYIANYLGFEWVIGALAGLVVGFLILRRTKP